MSKRPNDKAGWRDLIAGDSWPRVALVCLGVWLNAADSLVTSTIMPSVGRDLGGYAFFGWAVAGYLLGAITAGASAGQLSQRVGLRRALPLAAVLYAAGCGMSAASPGIAVFLIGRITQGVGAGWVVGLCYVAISVMFPARHWARIYAATAGVWGAATLLGPLVGGVFAEAGDWRGAFWMFGVQGVAFGIIALLLLRRTPRGPESAQPVAWRTLLILALGIVAIGAADLPQAWGSAGLEMALGLGLIILAAQVNAREGERLLPPDATRPSTTAGAGYLMMFAMSAAAAVLGVYGAALLQSLYGVSPLLAGYVVGMEALGWTLTALVVSSLPEDRHDFAIVCGATAIAAGLFLLAVTIASRQLWLVVAASAVMGAGFGLSWSPATRKILSSLPVDNLAIGSSAVPTTQMIGGAVGAAMVGAIANFAGLSQAFTAAGAHVAAPWLFAASLPVAAIGWLAALRLARATSPFQL